MLLTGTASGYMAPAISLPPGKQVRIEPHRVDGHIVGHRTRDVIVSNVIDADARHAAVEWTAIRNPHVRGTTVFQRLQMVLVLSSPPQQAA
jgi:hypothetical protein